MKRAKEFLSLFVAFVWLIGIILPIGFVYFALELLLNILSLFAKGIEEVKEGLANSIETVCDAFDDWLS